MCSITNIVRNIFMIFKTVTKTVIAPMLIAAFALSPAFAYARQGKGNNDGNKVKANASVRWQTVEDDDDDDNKNKKQAEERRLEREERQEERQIERVEQKLGERQERFERECLRAFGLLISRGHRVERFEELRNRVCFWPFGIWKKISTTTPPTTPDTTAPVISNIKTETRVFKAEVRWDTNEKARGVLYYSTTTPLNLSGATRLSRGPGREHRAELTPLAASTTYYALISATDLAGNAATSSEFSFTTKSAPPDTTAPNISAVAVLVSTTTIGVRWQTNEPATSKLFYGTTTPLDANASTTPFIESAALVRTHRLDLASLTASTTYYLIVESRDTSGNKGRTSQFQAMTLGL